MRKINKCFIGALPLLVGSYCYADAVPVDSDRWELHDETATVEKYLGEQSLVLNEGFAVVSDSDFTSGIIEYDIAFGSAPGFMGAIWHYQDTQNFEIFQMRPHNPKTPYAAHYFPYINGTVNFQVYYGEGYNATVDIPHDEWMHIKIIVSGVNAEIYIADMDNPAIVITELKLNQGLNGKVGLVTNLGMRPAATHFANFTYTSMDNPPLKETPAELMITPGIIPSWMISDPFEAKALEGKMRLSETDMQGNWNKLDSERSGLANFARVQGIKDGKNAAFARTTIISEKDQFKRMQFGFSDTVKIYFNGHLMYDGSDVYASRDYRFLGTTGLFDAVTLPLRKGNNELWMAASELAGGGWGVQAKFDDMEGIQLSTTETPDGMMDDGMMGDGMMGDGMDGMMDSCMASYSLDGNLRIPFVSVPSESGFDVYEADLHLQATQPSLTFALDELTLLEMPNGDQDMEDHKATGDQDMEDHKATLENNKKIAMRMSNEVVNQGKMEVADELLAKDYIYHGPGAFTVEKPEGYKQMMSSFRATFPDLKSEVPIITADGDYVTMYYTMVGTHTGADYQGIPISGNKMNIWGIILRRIENGQIVEDWDMYDTTTFIGQLQGQ